MQQTKHNIYFFLFPSQSRKFLRDLYKVMRNNPGLLRDVSTMKYILKYEVCSDAKFSPKCVFHQELQETDIAYQVFHYLFWCNNTFPLYQDHRKGVGALTLLQENLSNSHKLTIINTFFLINQLFLDMYEKLFYSKMKNINICK